ncbi:MAG TPA: cyclase family protein [Steroidobacteraceae bacterium]|nr:cyclase family protein [Steroidobacteraceae bacterium]
MTIMRFELEGRRLNADFAQPLSIAIPLDFNGPQPSFYDAPPATARPLSASGFIGDTRTGGSCNCEQLTLVPHCNGTHTECVGHVTDDRVAITDRLRGGIVLALLLSLQPVAAGSTNEDSDPLPDAADLLVTAEALAKAAAAYPGPAPRALIIRTLPCTAGRLTHAYRGRAPAPYLSRQAAGWLVERGIEHLVLDLPSADRADDNGRLTAHRLFFGLPAGGRHARDARRPQASITELAWVAPTIHDGWFLLDLQIPAFLADAAPSRPLLYPVHFE